jgi:hypothetical protein
LPEVSPSKRHDIGYSVYDTISHLRVSLTEMASTPEPLIFFHIKAKLKAFSFPEPPLPHQKNGLETTAPMTAMTAQLKKSPDQLNFNFSNSAWLPNSTFPSPTYLRRLGFNSTLNSSLSTT